MCRVSIAIDGPAGAGKSTVAKQLARELNYLYVDTGAMYRAISWLAIRSKLSPNDELALLEEINQHKIEFEKNREGLLDVFIDGCNISNDLRTPEVSEIVSLISVHPRIRALLTKWQREFATRYSVVMDGRDIGTVVLPEADVKVFLTADISERARRRSHEFSEQGFHVSLDQIVQSMVERDERDEQRSHAPLKQAEDAIRIDSTGKTVSEVVEEILDLVAKVKHG